MFGRSTATFDKLLEQATSRFLLEADWNAILQICDSIRQGDVQAKYAVSAIKKKLYAQNPHVALFALQVLESCVKNCGSLIHLEMSSRAFMEELRELAKTTPNENIKNKILELIQTWAHAFRNEPNYRAVQDTVNLMRMEGFKFPVLKESDAMFVADQAPEWAEGDCCHRCRVQFSLMQRKHHCRNCGQIFCSKCSSRNSPIPRYGIEKEVRVCDSCWDQLSKLPSVQKDSGSGSEQSPSNSSTQGGGNGKTEQELQEEEELQLALALSQSEAETRTREVYQAPASLYKAEGLNGVFSSPENNNNEPGKETGNNNMESELAHYLNRSYWEKKQDEILPNTRTSPVPSAPSTVITSQAPNSHTIHKVSEKYQNGEVDKMQEFLANLKGTLEIFVNRMKSNSSRGRPLANDTYVQSLFMNITNMHSQLLKYIQEQDDLRVKYEGLQDILTELRESRAALDALREEHMERRRREAEEAERQRQIQMAHKLEIMRKKKQEYLQYQRQIALQKMQEQEREMHLRQEQQKQQYQVMQQVSGVYGPAPPTQAPYMPPPTGPMSYRMPAAASAASGSPVHPQYGPPGAFGPPNNPMVPSSQQNYQSFSMQAIPGGLPPLSQGGQYPQGTVPVTCTSAVPVPSSMPNLPPGVMSPPPGVMSPPSGPITSGPGTISVQPLPQPVPNNMGNMHQIISPTNPPMSPPPGNVIPEQQQQPPPPPPPQQPAEAALITFD